MIVPELEDMGYQVDYREFSGKHDIPNELVPDALGWLGGRSVDGG